VVQPFALAASVTTLLATPGGLRVSAAPRDASDPGPGLSAGVPAEAPIHVIGGIDDRGRHVHAEYSTSARGDGLAAIRCRLEVPTLDVEFYYDPVSGRDGCGLTFPVAPAFPVDGLVVAVQKPRRAEGFRVDPPTDAPTPPRGSWRRSCPRPRAVRRSCASACSSCWWSAAHGRGRAA